MLDYYKYTITYSIMSKCFPDSTPGSGTYKKINLSHNSKESKITTESGNNYEMTIKPNEALVSESEPKVDMVTTQISADYNMRKRQLTQTAAADDEGDGEGYTTM